MQVRYGWKMTWSAAVVAITLFNVVAVWFKGTLPFEITRFDSHGMTVAPSPGAAFPKGLVPGEQIEFSSQNRTTRAAISANSEGNLIRGVTYTLSVHRPQGEVHIPVTTRAAPLDATIAVAHAENMLADLLLGAMALLLLWRGEGPAALSLALYCASYLVGDASSYAPAAGEWALVMTCAAVIGYAGARVGFYLMADMLVGGQFPSSMQRLARWLFTLLLAVGLGTRLFAYIHFVMQGSAEFLAPVYSLPFSFIYLVPLAMLVIGYFQVEPQMQLRLRWVLVGAFAIMVTVIIHNANIEPSWYLDTVDTGFYAFSILAMAYALLRHRVVAVSIFMDRALVYGLVTTLVVGVVAAVNSVALRFALPAGANLALQVVVPLSLGIVLGRVRTVLNRMVEQVFFRSKYLSQQALRDFTERAGYIDKTADLLEATVREIIRHLRTPAVAIYSDEPDGFRRLRQEGDAAYPAELGSNDDAAVALKARREATDLEGLASALGTDSCVFPLLVLGNLRGLLVVKNRPHEHFGPDEKELLTQVAQSVGAAWRILRARDNEMLVNAMAQGQVLPDAAFTEARRLARAWKSG